MDIGLNTKGEGHSLRRPDARGDAIVMSAIKCGEKGPRNEGRGGGIHYFCTDRRKIYATRNARRT